MIAYLSGKIIKKTEKGIIIDTGNVGYLVHVSKLTNANVNENESISLFIYSHIREDSFDLHGFENYETLEFFKQLISINGVGPKVAMEIISSDTDKIKMAIANEDDKFLCKIPGIGSKTAKRIVLELKGKITLENLDRPYQRIDEKMDDEAYEALSKLGYQSQQIRKILNNLPKEIKDTEQIITYFLKNI